MVLFEFLTEQSQEIGCKALNFIYAIGDFGHSYVEHQHEESRSIVAEGMRFVAPGLYGL